MNWISVNEALPESKDDSVLVCSVDGSKYDNNGFPEGGIDFVYTSEAETVDWWQPADSK